MDLMQFKLAIEGPMKWSESYKILGENQGQYALMGDDGPLRRFSSCWYHAECLICHESVTKQYQDRSLAVFWHFMHCARSHNYVFPENETRFKIEDPDLQYIITKSDEYGLPMPGFDDHSKCIKQYAGEKAVCAVHAGNEYKDRLEWY